MPDERVYLVTSPQYDYTEWVCEYGGPTYSVSDFCEVLARSKREARRLAIRHPDMQAWVDLARSDNKNPLAGLQVVEADECYLNECYGCEKCRPGEMIDGE